MSAVLIRDIESKDYLSVASVWHEAFVPLTDEALITAYLSRKSTAKLSVLFRPLRLWPSTCRTGI